MDFGVRAPGYCISTASTISLIFRTAAPNFTSSVSRTVVCNRGNVAPPRIKEVPFEEPWSATVSAPSSLSQISACNLLTDSSATGKSHVFSRPMVNLRGIWVTNGHYIERGIRNGARRE